MIRKKELTARVLDVRIIDVTKKEAAKREDSARGVRRYNVASISP